MPTINSAAMAAPAGGMAPPRESHVVDAGRRRAINREIPHAAQHHHSTPVMKVFGGAASRIVLIVEDELILRMRAVDMIEDAGYTSVEAVNADEALSILEARSDIALLFTDIQMPGSMDGLQLAHIVYERWPPIKIILVSGQLKLSGQDIPPQSRFFGKPVKSDEITLEMQTMIGHA